MNLSARSETIAFTVMQENFNIVQSLRTRHLILDPPLYAGLRKEKQFNKMCSVFNARVDQNSEYDKWNDKPARCGF